MAKQSAQKAAINGALTGRSGDGKFTPDETAEEAKERGRKKTPAAERIEEAREGEK